VSESSRSSRFSHSSNHSTRHPASRSANQSPAESSHRPADKRQYSDRQNSFHRLPLSINLSTMVVFPASLPPSRPHAPTPLLLPASNKIFHRF